MLSEQSLEKILSAIPRLSVGVLGDLFLDRYLDVDAALTEPSLETGLDAYQVVQVRAYPGAAGTVINNLAALGVGAIRPISIIGDDGEGYELRQALSKMKAVETELVLSWEGRRTPTYTKPMLLDRGQPPRELSRLDIKNRTPLPRAAEDKILEMLGKVWPEVEAVLILDQVSEKNCGVVTAKVRERLAELAEREPGKLVLADSRERIGLFRSVCLKPNVKEALRATGARDVQEASRALARRCGRPVFCTQGARGILAVDLRENRVEEVLVPAYPAAGPIDTVGAGDSTSAALACGLAAGASLVEAAAFGNLAASVTIQQLGTTGTANPAQVRARWREVGGGWSSDMK